MRGPIDFERINAGALSHGRALPATAAALNRLPDDLRAVIVVSGRKLDVEAIDLLTRAVGHVAPMLADATKPTKERVRLLWASAKMARDLGASDIVHDAFMSLAITTNLIDPSGRWVPTDVRETRRAFGAQDVEHVIKWALRGWNPFEVGPIT
jgi:hypothetical protein